MKVLIVYAHPSTKSYTYDILQQVKSSLTIEGLEYMVSDLYEMGFRTDLTEIEYEREGFAKIELPIPDDIKREHKKIEKADCIIFIYPVWWSDCPAKLKGWFDRVYSYGYAYGDYDPNKLPKMKTVKLGLVICTAGHPNAFLKEIGIVESMRNVMIDDRLGKRFNNKEMIILGGTLNKEKVRPIHSNIIKTIGVKVREILAE